MKRTAILIASLGLTMLCSPAQADDVLYEYGGWLIRDGKSGSVAKFQAGLSDALAECGSNTRLSPDGLYGNGTRKAIVEAAACETISAQLDTDSSARSGAITEALWSIVLPDAAVPSVSQRAASLKLTFEATDYDRMQWNFCQNTPFYRPSEDQNECHSNDKRSYITWGPNGATAGWGREVQAILNRYLETPANGTAFDHAFGNEAPAVRRMLTLEDSSNGSLETYLCGVWMDKSRRDSWTSGFKTLGRSPDVRTAYRDIYGSASFDAGKIAAFYKIWQSEAFALPVTEIDHAFFTDRAAHMGMGRATRQKIRDALTELKQSSGEDWPVSAAEVRRHIAKRVLPGNAKIKKDRLGRDAAFFVEGIGKANLSELETTAWADRGRRNVIHIGMSDVRTMPDFVPNPAISNPAPTGTVTEAERALCPAVVLNPQ